MRITSYLPLPLLGLLGYGLGALLYALGRGKVVAINLRLCFPEASSWQRFVWGLRHFMAQGRTFLELGVQWWQPLHRTTGYVTLHGAENLNAHSGKPVILLTPHFVGFNIGSAKISATWPCAGMYSENKDPQFDKMLRLGRTRFGAPTLLTKQDGLRQIVRTLKAGDRPLVYLPDMNFSARDCVFVPFFGVPAATLTAVARLAQLSGAVVLPVVTKQLSVWRGYETHIGTPW